MATLEDTTPSEAHPEYTRSNRRDRTMDFIPITQEDDTEEAEIIDDQDLVVWRWRAQQLHRLGLSWVLAHAFAAVVDWHDFARLVDRGCSPELALEIVR